MSKLLIGVAKLQAEITRRKKTNESLDFQITSEVISPLKVAPMPKPEETKPDSTNPLFGTW